MTRHAKRCVIAFLMGPLQIYLSSRKQLKCAMTGSSVQEIEVDNTDPVDIDMVSGPIITWTSGAKDNVVENIDSSDEDDGDYLPGDEYCSDADEEAVENKTKYKEFKKRYLEGEYLVFADGDKQGMTMKNLELLQVDNLSEDSDTSYFSASEEEDSYDERSDGELDRRKPKFPRFDKTAPIPSFRLGMTFPGKLQFRKAVEKYALAARKVIKFAKNDLKRFRAQCDWSNCPWFVLLSRNSRTDGWQVSSLRDEHACPARRDNKLVTARKIAEKFETSIIANPGWKIDHMKQTVQEQMHADVSISKCKRAKSIVMHKLLDSMKGQYARLFDYQEELLRSNPGSTIIVKLHPESTEPVFTRMYICFDACKKGFLAGCRKVIGLDGCFFKGPTTGELMCAMGRDGNNQMYPIAWAVVEKKTNDSWDWFCDILFRDLGVGDGEGWVIISDQQKGLINAVEKWVPKAEHRMCARHIYANWRKRFKDRTLQKKFWSCAKAPCMNLFNYYKQDLANDTPAGADAIMRTDPSHWSRAWFKLGSNCDSVDNNMCESFNHSIVESRFLPIIYMSDI